MPKYLLALSHSKHSRVDLLSFCCVSLCFSLSSIPSRYLSLSIVRVRALLILVRAALTRTTRFNSCVVHTTIIFRNRKKKQCKNRIKASPDAFYDRFVWLFQELNSLTFVFLVRVDCHCLSSSFALTSNSPYGRSSQQGTFFHRATEPLHVCVCVKDR